MSCTRTRRIYPDVFSCTHSMVICDGAGGRRTPAPTPVCSGGSDPGCDSAESPQPRAAKKQRRASTPSKHSNNNARLSCMPVLESHVPLPAASATTSASTAIDAVAAASDPLLSDHPAMPESSPVPHMITARSVRHSSRTRSAGAEAAPSAVASTNSSHSAADSTPRRTKRTLTLSSDKQQELLRKELETFPAVGSSVCLQLYRDSNKGLCVRAASFIPKDAFVVEYAGDLLTNEESKEVENGYYEKYTMDRVGCYMFWFKFCGKVYCVDATCPGRGEEPGTQLAQHLNINSPAPVTASPPPFHALPFASQLPSSVATAAAAAPAHARIEADASSASSATAATAPARLELLGYGYARYINHSRVPNLSIRVVDCASTRIQTNRFDGSQPRGAVSSLSSSSSSSSSSSFASTPALTSSAVSINLFNSYPRMCFFANRDIRSGEELLIDYGDREKDSLEQHPWLKG